MLHGATDYGSSNYGDYLYGEIVYDLLESKGYEVSFIIHQISFKCT